MKLRSYQNMSVLGFVDPEILIAFLDHQLMNGFWVITEYRKSILDVRL